MKFLLLILIFSVSLYALDPYTMTLDECRAYIKANNLKWEAGVTPYTYLPKEAAKLVLAPLKIPLESKVKSIGPINSNVKNPEYLDWTNMNGTNWMTSVKNQGNCGSCWSFAVMGTWEAMINLNSNNPDIDWDASEQYMVSTCYTGGDCGGGPAGTGPPNWVRANGVPDEACYPYRAKNSNCNERCGDWANRLKYIKTVTNVCTTANTEAIKAALRNGPVGTAMQANAMMMRFYKSGTLGEFPGIDVGYPINHAVVIVGWDDSRNGGSWKWKNSWGTGWGEAGYGWMTFGSSQMGSYTWSCTAFSEGAQGITVIYPNGGETFNGGQSVTVTWSGGDTDLVDIAYSTDAGATWTYSATKQNNNHAYNWKVPQVSSTTCRILVKANDNSDTGDTSDSNFTIKKTGFDSCAISKYVPIKFTVSICPNPVKNLMRVNVTLPERSLTKICVYDIVGNLVKVLKHDYLNKGDNSIVFDTSKVSQGVYTIILTGKYNYNIPIVVVK